MTSFKRARSAVTGRFVRLKIAIRNPKTTIVETVRKASKEKPADGS